VTGANVKGIAILENIIMLTADYTPYLVYLGIFATLVLCGLGLPLPEESILIGGGYLSSSGFLDYRVSLAICFFGVLAGDYIIFTIGRRWGHGVISSKYLQQFFTPRRLVRVRRYYRDHGDKTVFTARFFSGFRLAAFITAGMMKMRSRSFVLIDMAAALISVPLFFYLGFLLHDNLEALIGAVRNINRLLFVLAVLIFATYLIYRRRRRA